jgi:hypothetical protein
VSSFLLLNGLCVQMATSNAVDYEKSAMEGGGGARGRREGSKKLLPQIYDPGLATARIWLLVWSLL